MPIISSEPAKPPALWGMSGNIPPQEMAEPHTFFTWGNPPFRVDILTRISGVTFEDAWNRREIYTVNDATGLTAPFISAPDLLALPHFAWIMLRAERAVAAGRSRRGRSFAASAA